VQTFQFAFDLAMETAGFCREASDYNPRRWKRAGSIVAGAGSMFSTVRNGPVLESEFSGSDLILQDGQKC